MTKLRTIELVSIFLCAIAAALCGAGNPLASIIFCVSSTIGLIDSINNKVLSASLINGIFLTLNLYSTIVNFF